MSNWTRREFIQGAAGSLALGAGLGLGGCQQSTAPRTPTAPTGGDPNVVLIMLDTLRADKLGCYGYDRAQTSPALDALASRGVLMDRVVSQCCWTRPSVGSLLTSLHPRTIGLFKEKGEIIHSRHRTLPMILKDNGYHCFGITANPNINSLFNFNQGFDTYVDSNVLFGWMDQKDGTQLRGDKVHLPGANAMFDRVLEHAESGVQGPHYVQVNAMEIHEWYVRNTMIRPEYRNMYTDIGEKYPRYMQSVRQLTDDVAAFTDTLSKVPGWENTLFVIVSDHGEGLDEHQGVDKAKYHGWLLYESQVVVPWILYNPQWTAAQQRIQQPVRLLELAPTVLDYLGIEQHAAMEGHSILPAINGAVDRVNLPEYFITETHWRNANKIAAYSADWKYFENRTKHQGLPRYELQARGVGECGVRTDQLSGNSEVAMPMKSHIKTWETGHPNATATAPAREMSQEEIDQLEAIGYLPGGDEGAEQD